MVRGAIFHTPRSPFREAHALETFLDGALVIHAGRIVALGDYAGLRAAYPAAAVTDWRGSVILPGFIDAHTHFPQTRIIGGLGLPLLDWLRLYALPEEERMRDAAYARQIAGEFCDALVRHGTTTALVFGAHFAGATGSLFEAAEARGLRLASGLVFADRYLPGPLLQSPDAAYRAAKDLIARFHNRGRLRYAVTPRFALSSSEACLEVCAALLREHSDALFQTHLNENPDEIAAVRAAFPRASGYFDVYDGFGLSGRHSVFAHDVHVTDTELRRVAETRSSIAHCPCSNAALGSGVFPMRRHLDAGIHFALGTDVGAGIGLGMLKESLHSYLVQRLTPDGVLLSPAHLLYLATRAGAEALDLADETGDFTPGKSADFVRLRPPQVAHPESSEALLGALIAQADAESVLEVRVAGNKPGN